MAIATPHSGLDSILASRRLPALNGMRAVVILPVIIYHFGYSAPAALSVTMFFVLSGFLITWILLKEFETTKTISIRSFYLRRALRIFPAYYAFIGASIVTDRFISTPWTSDQVLAAATYTINYLNAFKGHDATPTEHAWSLAVEEQFYLLWPVGLLLLLRRGGIRLATVLLACSVIAAPIWRSLLYVGFHFPAHYIYNAFDTRYDTLATGCLIAILARRHTFGRIAETSDRNLSFFQESHSSSLLLLRWPDSPRHHTTSWSGRFSMSDRDWTNGFVAGVIGN